MTIHFEVVVVGAGISGLIAARKLLAQGVTNLVILEARDRIGGRIHIVENDDDVLDLGAHFVHGTVGNAVYTFAHPRGLMMPEEQFPTKNNYIFARGGEQIDGDIGTRFEIKFDELFEAVRMEEKFSGGNLTLADIFDEVKRRLLADPDLADIPAVLKEDLFSQFTKLECLDLATSAPEKVSAVGISTWQDCQEPYYSILKDGYASVLPLIADEIPDRFIKLNSVVTKVLWSDTACIVTCHQLEHPEVLVTISANRVICTVPLGCLKADQISFVPHLPDSKQEAIKSIGFGLIDKYNIQFKTRWWPENCNNLFIIWPSSASGKEEHECDRVVKSCLNPALYEKPEDMLWYRHVYAFDVEPIVRSGNYLVAYSSGYWAAVVERLPDEELLNVLNVLISTFLAPNFENVELPFKIIRSKWQSEPFSRGSYSLMAVGSTPAMLDALAEPLPSRDNPRLMFAGEATHHRYFSAVHGAWESGEREADRILAASK